MKTFAKTFMLALIMLAVSNVHAQKGDNNAMKEKIQTLNNKLAQAIIQENDDAILAYYTKDAVSLPNYNAVQNGIEAIKKQQVESKQMGNKVTSMKFVTVSVKEYGDAIVEVGTYDVTLSMKGSDKPVTDKGKYLTIWEKQSDGTLKMSYEIWNTDTNPMQQMKGQHEGNNSRLSPDQKQDRMNQKDGGQIKSVKKNPNSETNKEKPE